MKELDFLPADFVAALYRRQQNRRNLLLFIGLGLAMASLHLLNVTRIRSAEASLAALRNGSGGWQSAREQLAALELQKSICRQRAGLLSAIDDAAPLDAAVGEISRLLSEAMAIRSLSIDAQPPTSPETGANETTLAGSAPQTRAVLTGVAGTDVEVGIFLGRMSSCPLFTDVTLSYSREARGSGRLMREFEVKFTLRPVEATP